MEPWLQARTPNQLLWLIAAANALAVIGFVLVAPMPWHSGIAQQTPHQHPLLDFCTVVIGIVASLFVEQELTNGFAANRWPDDTMARVRKLVVHPVFTIVPLLFLIVGVVSTLISPPHNMEWLWMAFWPTMSMVRLRALALPEKPSRPNRLFTPGEAPKPLHPDHWGNPPGTFAR